MRDPVKFSILAKNTFAKNLTFQRAELVFLLPNFPEQCDYPQALALPLRRIDGCMQGVARADFQRPGYLFS
jgi:hypothetical protein